MSLITQCPACATMFRVVPDQLRISEGWVRCGQCDEVFDANAHLQALNPAAPPTPPPVSAAASVPMEAIQAEPVPVHASNAQSVVVEDAYDWGGIDAGTATSIASASAEPPAEHALAPEPEAAAGDAEGRIAESEAEYVQEQDPFLSQSPHDLSVAEESMAEQYAAVAAPEMAQPAGALADDIPLSFMPQIDKPSRLGRWLGPPFLITLSLVLTLALGCQVLLQERHRLAAAFPDVRPVLQVLCGVVGCQINAPRQIDAIAIESSAFSSIRPGVYLLRVTLKNTGTLALETPALELILTDMQDRPLLRRVVQGSEYANTQPVLAAGAELNLGVPMSVHTAAMLEKIAGYKLLAFYP